MVYLESTQYKGWKGYRLGNSYYEVIIIPAIGGRIMGFSSDGNEVLFTMPYLKGQTLDLQEDIGDITEFRKAKGWMLYGGYKTWLAPQDRWQGPPYIDLDSGPYSFQILSHTHKMAEILLKSPVCRETGMQFVRKIRVTRSDKHLVVYQGMINKGDQTVEYGLWDVTQLNGPGRAVLPLGSSRYFDGIKSFDPQGEALKSKTVETDGEKAVIHCRGKEQFKYGTDYTQGWISAFLPLEDGGEIEYRKTFYKFDNAVFGHGCAVEVFGAKDHPYFEIGVHGPVVPLKPGEEFGFEEIWELKIHGRSR